MHRVTAIVVTALLLTGCGVGDQLRLGERTEFIVRSPRPEGSDQYGTYGVAPLHVARGQPTPAGTPYYVTIGFANGTPPDITAIDSTGAEHPPLDTVTPGEPCPTSTTSDSECRVFVMPPGTELVGLTFGDVH